MLKADSIFPFSFGKQYASECKDTPLEIRIYPGADATFVLYEDEGDNYNYEQGKFSMIEFEWNENKKTLVIANRKGGFEGMERLKDLIWYLFHRRKESGQVLLCKCGRSFTKVKNKL